MVRLKDIAFRAGCSMMTVSKALRGATDVSPETKARIILLAQQMGYVPNSTAQCLRSRSTKLLGLVLPTITNSMLNPTVAAIEERTHELGYELILAHTLNSVDREEICLTRLVSRRVEGIFVFPVYRLSPTASVYQELAQRRVPTVILGQKAPFCAQFPNVETDDLRGSFFLTRHLLELGHKKIAFFAGPISSPVAQERLEGYRRALRESGLEIDDRLIFAAGTTVEDGQATALQMLNESTQVTAVQAVNDFVAIGAANVFLENRIRIPEDISIAGYGNIPTSEHFRVPLTTVRHPKQQLGEAAVEIMLQVINGVKTMPVRLPVEIIIRESSSSPKKPE